MEKSPASSNNALGLFAFSAEMALCNLAYPPELKIAPFCSSLTGRKWSCKSWVKRMVIVLPAPSADALVTSMHIASMEMNNIRNITDLNDFLTLSTPLFQCLT